MVQSIAPQLFAFSIIPYSGFLYYLTKSKQAPPVALFGFYFLLVFVAVSIPAGIYGELDHKKADGLTIALTEHTKATKFVSNPWQHMYC